MHGVNLIPTHRREAAKRSRRVRRWLAGGGVYFSLLVAVCGLTQLTGGQERAVALAASNADTQAASLQRSVNTLRSELSNAAAAHSTLATLADPPDWTLLLIGLHASAGTELKLRDIHLIPQQASANAADPPQTFEVRLSGICRSQADVTVFVQRLQNDNLFSRIELLRSGREAFENGMGVAFDIRCTIGGSDVPAGSGNR